MPEDRKFIWDNYTGNKPRTIEHNFVDYDRYFEANLIRATLKREIDIDFKSLRVVDFGCCAGDYGIYFARLGSPTQFIDIDPDAMSFVEYRLGLEGLINTKELFIFDLAIFGEVLEHCDDPLGILNQYVKNKTRAIFTSSYPYRSDDPNDNYWNKSGHSKKALESQKDVRKLLEDNYKSFHLGGERRLWIYNN